MASFAPLGDLPLPAPLARLTPPRPWPWVLGLFLLAAGLTAWQQLALGNLNNYLVFTRPLLLFFEGRDPYSTWTHSYFIDGFRYSPTFMFVVGWMSYVPNWLGVLVWNALNAVALATALRRVLSTPQALWWGSLFVLLEAITSMQNLQSNCLLAGLMIHGAADARSDRPLRAALWIGLAAYIKIYGIAVAALFIMRPSRWRAYAALAVIGVLLALVPLLGTGGDVAAAIALYRQWLAGVSTYTTAIQLSAMGMVQAWTGVQLPYREVQVAALALTVAPLLLRWRLWSNAAWAVSGLALLMVYVVVFNQVAESPVYIIAMCGILLMLTTPRVSWAEVAIAVLAWVLTSLLTTDLLPVSERKLWYEPLKLKVLPVLLAWIALQVRLWRWPLEPTDENRPRPSPAAQTGA